MEHNEYIMQRRMITHIREYISPDGFAVTPRVLNMHSHATYHWLSTTQLMNAN